MGQLEAMDQLGMGRLTNLYTGLQQSIGLIFAGALQMAAVLNYTQAVPTGTQNYLFMSFCVLTNSLGGKPQQPSHCPGESCCRIGQAALR